MKKKNLGKRIFSLGLVLSMAVTGLPVENVFGNWKGNIVKAESINNSGGDTIVTNGAIKVTTSSAMVVTSSGILKDYWVSFSGGNGTKESPYQIANAEQLKALLETIYSGESEYNNKCYQLTADISMKDVEISYDDIDTYAFHGEFDGNGHSISDLKAPALFPHTKGAVIKDLTLKAATISSSTEYVGGIVGLGEGRLTISGCVVDENSSVTISGGYGINYIGGICGYSETGKITNCTNSAICENNDKFDSSYHDIYIGGISGYCKSVLQCENYGTVQIRNDSKNYKVSEMYMGGIAGIAKNISNCNNKGLVIVDNFIEGKDSTVLKNIGGIVGGCGTTEIENSTNQGNIKVKQAAENETSNRYNNSVGGIIGFAGTKSKINGCVNEGDIVSDFYATGGIIGQIYKFETVIINNCINHGNIDGKEYVGGIAGINRNYSLADYGYNKILNCENEGIIKGTLNVGGIAGKAGNMVLEKCKNKAQVILSASDTSAYAGGIAGLGNQISFCENEGTILKEISNTGRTMNSCIGGIVGSGTVYASTNKGNVNGNDGNNVGGIIGIGSAITSVNIGSVEGSSAVGGIAGSSELVYRSYNTGTVTGTEKVGGISGIANGTLTQSYTCGTVEGEETSKNIGTAIGFVENLDGTNNFYLKNEKQKAIGNDTKFDGISEKTNAQLKSNDVLTKLNETIKIEVYCFSNWVFNSKQNDGYPILQTTGRIRNDEYYRNIEVYSEQPIYYAYLPLKTDKYSLQSSELKEAVSKNGYYYVDYSECELTKSYCLALTDEKKTYNVEGFNVQQGKRTVFKSYNGWSGIDKTAIEKEEKMYTCKGSDFSCIFNIQSYAAKYTSKVSKIKFDYNWDDDSNAEDSALISEISYSYFGILSKEKRNSDETYIVQTAKKMQAKIRPSDFLWKEDGEETWREPSELTENMLKGYAKAGTVLKMRFPLEYNLYMVYEGDEAGYYSKDKNLSGFFLGNEVTVKLSNKEKSTPKIKVDLSKMTINIKNGMQYSYDQKTWNTVFPYANSIYAKTVGYDYQCGYVDDLVSDDGAADYVYGDGYYEGYMEGSGENSSGSTCRKIASMPVSYFDSSQKYIYVRSIGSNILPSEPCKIELPAQKTPGPTVTFEKSASGKFTISEIMQGEGDTVADAQYEYCIVDQDLREYISKGASVKWKNVKKGAKITQKINTVYAWTDIGLGLKKIKDEDGWGEYVVTKKRSIKKTCMLGYTKLKIDKETDEGNSVSYIAVRRKNNKSSQIPASCTSYYYYNAQKETFTLITQKGEY